MRYADLDDKILLYDNEQTDQINKNTTDIDNNIKALKTVTYTEGTTNGVFWRKYDNGEMLMRGETELIITSTHDSDTNLYFGNSSVWFPTRFVGTPLATIANRRKLRLQFPGLRELRNDAIDCYLISTKEDGSGTVMFEVVGRWK